MEIVFNYSMTSNATNQIESQQFLNHSHLHHHHHHQQQSQHHSPLNGFNHQQPHNTEIDCIQSLQSDGYQSDYLNELIRQKFNDATVIISVVILVLINFIVIAGNVLVILSVFTTNKLRTVTNFFIVSLAVADLLVGIAVLPYSLTIEVLDTWIFGELWCQGWLVIDVWMCTASILNLCAISVDRYLAVTQPVRYRSLMTAKRAKYIIAVVWILSFIICFPLLVVRTKETQSVLSVRSMNRGQPSLSTFPSSSSSSSSLSLSSSPSEWYESTIINEHDPIKMVERAMSITTTTVNESNQLNIDIDSTLMPSFDDHENTITTTTATTTTTSTTLPPPSTPTAPSTTSARPSFPCIPEPIQCALFLNKHYVIYSAFGSFYIPMFVMIFFYWRIYLVAIRTSRALKRGYRTTKTTGDGSNEERLTLRIHRGYDCNESNDQMNITTSSSSFNNSRTNKKKNKIGKNSMDGRVRTRVPITIYKATTRTSTTSTMGCDSSGSEVASGAAAGGAAAAGDGGGRRQSTLIVNHLSISGGHGGGGGAIKSTSSNTLSPGDHNMSQTDNRLNNGQQHHHHHHNRRNSPGCQSTLSLPFSSSSPSSSRESSARSNQVVMARLSKRTSKYQAKRFHAETKAAKTVGIIVGGFIVCWLPFFTVYLIRAFCGDCISKLVFQIFFWLGYCNSMINPCIYGLFSRDFRRAFRNILCRCKFGEETSVSSLIRQIHMPTFFEDMPEEMAKQESQEY